MAYTTAALVKSYLGISGSGDDTLIGNLVISAQAMVDAHCGRTFEAAADTTRYIDVVRNRDYRTLYLDKDLCQITTVTTNADRTGGGDVVAAAEYITLPKNSTPYYALRLKSDSDYSWEYTDDSELGVAIVGRWAYSTSAPADVAQACLRLTAFLYRQKDAQVFDVTAIPDAGIITVPQGFPADVKLMLSPYVLRVPMGISHGN